MATTEPHTTGVQAEDLQPLLDGRYGSLRRQIRDVLARQEFAPPIALATTEYRELVLRWMQAMAGEGLTTPGFSVEYGGHGNPSANIAGFETIAYGDPSLLVKFGVQFGLWGGAVQQLGTRVHHERYLRATATLELPGCLAMTESGHGSNVQALQTTATYDPATDEFVIDTPGRGSAQGLHRRRRVRCPAGRGVRAADRGRRRPRRARARRPAPGRARQPEPGVRIEDCGEKMGLNGVDNGRIWFDHVRVPRDALLDRYGGVNGQGRYESPIEKANKRFFTMLGNLIQGRICISGASVSAAKSELTIAVRYGLDQGYDPFEVFAEALVDAFGIPDEVLRAPIAVR